MQGSVPSMTNCKDRVEWGGVGETRSQVCSPGTNSSSMVHQIETYGICLMYDYDDRRALAFYCKRHWSVSFHMDIKDGAQKEMNTGRGWQIQGCP